MPCVAHISVTPVIRPGAWRPCFLDSKQLAKELQWVSLSSGVKLGHDVVSAGGLHRVFTCRAHAWLASLAGEVWQQGLGTRHKLACQCCITGLTNSWATHGILKISTIKSTIHNLIVVSWNCKVCLLLPIYQWVQWFDVEYDKMRHGLVHWIPNWLPKSCSGSVS